jgi:hypothetical protein
LFFLFQSVFFFFFFFWLSNLSTRSSTFTKFGVFGEEGSHSLYFGRVFGPCHCWCVGVTMRSTRTLVVCVVSIFWCMDGRRWTERIRWIPS